MIKELTWDSQLFKRKIGVFTIDAGTLASLGKALKQAGKEGYQYLLCKLKSQDTHVIRALESDGFYLTDVGVTFGIETSEFLTRNKNYELVKSCHSREGGNPGARNFLERMDSGLRPPDNEFRGQASEMTAMKGTFFYDVKNGVFVKPPQPLLAKEGIPPISDLIIEAMEQDIPQLKKLIPSIFPESRFYHDPFFSKKEADNLYRAWIENSVKWEEADIVFHIPRIGFVTCKKQGRHSGKIVLIGVKKKSRGKGYGSALLFRAMEWFAGQGTDFVTVRTQLKNLQGMNFYLRFGFFMTEYDLMFGKMLDVKRERAKE